MRLTQYTNYAMRTLMYCALQRDQVVRIADIASDFGISRAHLLKIARQLGQLGYLETLRGRNGGIRLAMAPEQVSVGEVVRIFEASCAFVECFSSETNRCPIAGPCKLTGLFRQALEAFYKELDSVTLGDLVHEGDSLRERLPLVDITELV